MPRPARRSGRRVVAVAALVLGALALAPAPATAGGGSDGSGIRVVQVQGLLDAPNASLIREAIVEANDDRASLLVLQIDSNGALDVDVDPIIEAIDRSEVPIAAWVGPSGADASGSVTLVAEAAHFVSVSQGSGIGSAYPARLDRPAAVGEDALGDRLAELAAARDRDPDGARRLAGSRLSAEDAERVGAIDSVEPIVGELIVSLDGERITTAAGDVTLSTARVVGSGLDRRREPNQEVLFERLDLADQVLHTLISPSIAYFLFVAGLALLVFEFFTASVGFAGATGAIAVVGAATGFAHLPVRWWAVALLVAAMLAYAVDAQAGAGVGVWTGIGSVLLVVGSLSLYGGSPRLDPSWWVLLLVILGTAAFMVGGLAAMIRARFSTPTVGREGLVGAMGTAEVAVDPDGIVLIDGSRWRARTNRATPIRAGEPARVVSIEGVVLEVEPETGAARDHRERRRKNDA